MVEPDEEDSALLDFLEPDLSELFFFEDFASDCFDLSASFFEEEDLSFRLFLDDLSSALSLDFFDADLSWDFLPDVFFEELPLSFAFDADWAVLVGFAAMEFIGFATAAKMRKANRICIVFFSFITAKLTIFGERTKRSNLINPS